MPRIAEELLEANADDSGGDFDHKGAVVFGVSPHVLCEVMMRREIPVYVMCTNVYCQSYQRMPTLIHSNALWAAFAALCFFGSQAASKPVAEALPPLPERQR